MMKMVTIKTHNVVYFFKLHLKFEIENLFKYKPYEFVALPTYLDLNV